MATGIHRPSARSSALIVCEALLIVSALGASTYMRLGHTGWGEVGYAGGVGEALLIPAGCQLCLYSCDLYDLRSMGDQRELLVRLLQALGATSMILAFTYFWFPSLVIGRGVFLAAAGMVIGLILSGRVAFDWLMSHAGPRERLLIVGASPAAITLARELFERRKELGVEIVGFVDPDSQMVGAPIMSPGVIGTLEDIPSIV